MYVRLLYGPKAGETEFMLAPVARQLIAQGRAEDAQSQPVVVANEDQPAAPGKMRKVKAIG